MSSEIDALVQDQYENFPYPHRDPADEAKRLLQVSPSGLDEVAHFLFQGHMDRSVSFQALIAGGGTGDSLVMLAQQMVDAGQSGHIDYLDMSTASRAVAEARIQARGLSNVTFHTASLLDVASLAIGPFDYIDCCGVLHHLDDPGAGLRSLASVLKPTGGMGLMVYGEYGRDGLYPVQDLLRELFPIELPPADRIDGAKRLFATLPATNPFKRNPFMADHRNGKDTEIFDLLLHSRDQSYTTAKIDALLAKATLGLVSYTRPARYKPEAYISNPLIRGKMSLLSAAEQRALAEVLCGNIKKHTFYAVPAKRLGRTLASLEHDGWEHLVPLLREVDGKALAQSFQPGMPLTVTLDTLDIKLQLPPLAGAIMRRIDGQRTLSGILSEMRETSPDLTDENFRSQFSVLFDAFVGVGRMLLRRENNPQV